MKHSIAALMPAMKQICLGIMLTLNIAALALNLMN